MNKGLRPFASVLVQYINGLTWELQTWWIKDCDIIDLCPPNGHPVNVRTSDLMNKGLRRKYILTPPLHGTFTRWELQTWWIKDCDKQLANDESIDAGKVRTSDLMNKGLRQNLKPVSNPHPCISSVRTSDLMNKGLRLHNRLCSEDYHCLTWELQTWWIKDCDLNCSDRCLRATISLWELQTWWIKDCDPKSAFHHFQNSIDFVRTSDLMNKGLRPNRSRSRRVSY